MAIFMDDASNINTYYSESKVTSIFSAKKSRNSKRINFWGSLKTADDHLNELVQSYHEATACGRAENGRLHGDIAIDIANHETSEPVDLLIKFAILENELKFRCDSQDPQVLHEQFMFQYFKRSLIVFLEEIARLR